MPVIGTASVIGDAPLSKAQEHAALADELRRVEDYSKAAQEHLKAAEGYLESVQYTQDARLQTFLRRMHMDQLKLAEDLQRRIAQKERERQRDPPSSRAGMSSSSSQKPHSSRRVDHGRRRGGGGGGGYQSQSDASPSMTPPLSLSPKSSSRRMQDSVMSDRTSESGSYMMLGPEFPEAGDRFHRFWNDVEGMVDQLTQAVAFASLPLDDRDPEEVIDIPDDSDGVEAVERGRSGKGNTEDAEFEADEDSSDSDSFYLIPSASASPVKPRTTSVASTSTTITPTAHVTSHNKQLQDDNEKLRVEMDQMRVKMSKLENVMKYRAGQSAQLKESIMLAKREAQRNLMQSITFRQPPTFPPMSPLLLESTVNSVTPTPSSAAFAQQRSPSPFFVPPPLAAPGPVPASGSPSAVHQQRIRELEEENRSLKSEVTKLKSQNSRFREKWATLKEGARRKRMLRDQQAVRTDGDGVGTDDVRRMSIKEEDEEDDGDDGPGGR